MQVKFAYAASGSTQGGEASIGVAARAVAASANQVAAWVTVGKSARLAACPSPFDQDKQNEKQAASRWTNDAQPDRSNRSVPRRTSASSVLPSRTARARSSTSGNGGMLSASVPRAARAALEIGATFLAGGVQAGKGMPSARIARRHRVGPRVVSTPACRHQDADFAQHGEARFRTLVPGPACAGAGVKKCAAWIEMPKTLKAKPTTHRCARMAAITLRARGASPSSAITLHDFKDGVRAVLDVVKV